MKAFLVTIGVVILLIPVGYGLRFVAIGLGIINLPIKKLENKVNLNSGVIDKTYSLEYCLGNYEWFKDTFQKINQSTDQIKNKQDQLDEFLKSAGERANWTFEDKQQYNRISNEVTGLKNYKLDIVGQYNSRAEQLQRVACKELPLFVQP